MTSWEYLVGFESEPSGLDAFLARQGCERLPDADPDTRLYQSRIAPIDLIYAPVEEDEESDPDWTRTDRTITHELAISTKEQDSYRQARELASATVKEFRAVGYDVQDCEFFDEGE